MHDYLTIEETAQLTGLKPSHLARLRYLGQGPKYFKPTPRVVRYARSDVVAFMDASRVETAQRA